MKVWLTRAIIATLTLAAFGVIGLSVIDGWRPAGGNGVAWIEFLLHDEPGAHVDEYLRAVAAGDRDRALSLWQIPDRGAPDALAALRDRRPEVTDTLLAFARRGHRVVEVQWWSMCCEPHPVRDRQYASVARITVAFDDAVEQYTFDVSTDRADRSPLDEVARRWGITDVYRSGDQPMLLRWVATPTGSMTLGSFIPPRSTDCGRSEELPPTSYDVSARDCVWVAYSSGTPARWSVKLWTQEGDPVRATLTAQTGFIVATRDMTADRFSAPPDRRLWVWQCRAMSKRPWVTDPARYFFELTGCSGDGPTALFP